MMKKINTRVVTQLYNFIFILLFIIAVGLLGWILDRYSFEVDLTRGERNSLTEASINMITRLDNPVTITAFVRDGNKLTRDRIGNLIEQYHRHKPDIELKFINPDIAPQLVREHGITIDGEMLVQYGKRRETVQNISEKSLTQLLMRLANTETSFIAFVEGHGERKPLGKANHDLGDIGRQLATRGFNLQSVNLAKSLSIPENIKVLVIASPQTVYLPGEVNLVEQYLDKGGNLLWLTEPDSEDGLDSLAAKLNIKRLPGVVVDATTQLFGISDPTFALAVDYPRHAITERLHSQTLFPRAAGILSAEETDWETTPILNTLERSWTELDEVKGDIRFDPDTEEHAGPITIGIALQLSQTDPATDDEALENTGTQRIIIVGDGDFMSNTYLGNGQNMSLGISLFQWLGHNDQFIDIDIIAAPDTHLEVSETGAIALLLAFLILLPLGLLTTGIMIWLRRRNS